MGYQCYSRKRKDKSQGRIANCVIKSDGNDCLKVSEGTDTSEYLITRHSQFLTPINIINVYGEQENRTPANEVEENWNKIANEIVKIESKGESFILIGDLNKHLPTFKEQHNGKVSVGGKHLQEFIDNNESVQTLFADTDPDVIGDKLVSGLEELTNLVVTKK